MKSCIVDILLDGDPPPAVTHDGGSGEEKRRELLARELGSLIGLSGKAELLNVLADHTAHRVNSAPHWDDLIAVERETGYAVHRMKAEPFLLFGRDFNRLIAHEALIFSADSADEHIRLPTH
jgi:hypothetical protein